MPEPSDTRPLDDAPTPGPETRRLGALVGRWRSEGHVVGEPPVPVEGTDVYEWLPGGFFLVHHVDVVVGDQPVQAIEIIGEYDPATDSFTGRAYDNLGNVTVMRAGVQPGVHDACHGAAGRGCLGRGLDQRLAARGGPSRDDRPSGAVTGPPRRTRL